MTKPEVENFLDIKEFEGLYKVSDLGNVINKKGNKLKTSKCRKGHEKVNLSSNSINYCFTVARLVASHFLSGYTGKKQIVSHKDGNKSNNKFHNLEINEPKGNTMLEAENAYYKVFDVRNRLLLVTPFKRNANIYVKEKTGCNSCRLVLDTLIAGQFIIRKHIQKQLY